MNKKLLALMLVTVVILSTVLTACGGGTTQTPPAEEKPAKTTAEAPAETTEPAAEGEQRVIVWNIGQEPKTWDPVHNTMDSGSGVVKQLFEGLTYFSEDGIQPGVAETWETSEDGLTWTFHLREDAKWSDGQPVTANDFAYSWRRMCEPTEASQNLVNLTDYVAGAKEYYDGTGTYEDIKITATDDYTLEVVLKNPTPFFDQLISNHYYAPTRKDMVDNGDGWEKRTETAVSNGPYKVGEYVVGSHIVFEKNENYWDADNVNIKTIKGVFITDPNTAMQASQAGDIDVNAQIPTEEIQRLMAEEPYLHVKPWSGVWFLSYNTDRAPMNDIKVRQAISMAIDRKAIVENVTKAGEIAATGFINPVPLKSDGTPYRVLEADGMPKEEYGINPRQANVEAAQALLAEAGYPNGEGFPEIKMLYNTSDANKKVMEAIQQMLKENLNITTTLENMESNVYFDFLNEGDYDIGRVGWISSSFNVNGCFSFLTAQNANNKAQWRWEQYDSAPWDTVLNPDQKKFDDLYQESMAVTGAERDAKIMEAEAALMESMPSSPIYYYTKAYYVNEDHIEGLKTSPDVEFIFKTGTVVE